MTADVGTSWTQLAIPAAKLPSDSDGETDVFFVINAEGPATLWLASASMESQGVAPMPPAAPPPGPSLLLTNPQLTADGLHAVNDNDGKITGNMPGGWDDNSA